MVILSRIQLSALLLGSILQATEQEHITSWVLKRFYLIRRLEKTLDTLRTHTTAIDQSLVQQLISHLQHEYIRKQVALIATTGNLQPLYTLWKHLYTYRSLQDELLAYEFARIVYTITQGVTFTTHKFRTQPHTDDIVNITRRFYLVHRLKYAVERYCLSGDIADPVIFMLHDAWDDVQHYKYIESEAFSLHICSLIIAMLAPEKSPLLSQEATLESTLTIIDDITDQMDQEYAQRQKMSYFQKLCALFK